MMKSTRTLPSIHIPIQDVNGSVGWAWYMFFQWVSENVGSVDLSDYFTKEETEELLSAKANIDDLSDVAFSGDYDDLSNKPTIPTVNNATLTIQKNGTTIETFTANASSDVTANITVPTKISDLTNDSNFANTDLSNLTYTGTNIANWSSNITNCITTIPQDIKLELGGTPIRVILKSGSKVYVPNGVGVFDEVIIQSDVLGTRNAADCLVFYDNTNDTVRVRAKSEICVGTSDSLSGTAGHCWYDATNNLIKYYSDGSTTVTGYLSLPVGEAHGSGTFVDTIDQVFNGFGYIGSTVFVLPGVKALKPNGRNIDGTLKNTEITISYVLTTTNPTGTTKAACLGLSASSIDYSHSYKYDQASNTNNYDIAMVGEIDMSSGTITAIRPKQVFHALDYNDKDYIVTQVMPDYSSRISTGLTGSPTSATTASYTCPTNGWIQLKADRSSAGYTLFLYVNGAWQLNFPAYNASFVALMYPVKSGDVILLKTDNASATWVVNRCDFLPCTGG